MGWPGTLRYQVETWPMVTRVAVELSPTRDTCTRKPSH